MLFSFETEVTKTKVISFSTTAIELRLLFVFLFLQKDKRYACCDISFFPIFSEDKIIVAPDESNVVFFLS